MSAFLFQKEVIPTYLRFFNKEGRRSASAQMNLRFQYEEIITRDEFWQAGIFIKPWLPWEAFINSKEQT